MNIAKHVTHTVLGIAAAAALLALAPPASAQSSGSHAPRTAPAPHAPSAHRASDAHPSADAPDGVVNIQTATVEQLQSLPGIGPSKAEAIVAFRTAHPFQRVEDILRVRGIGRATFRRLRSMITVSGATTMTTDVRAGRAHAASTTPDAPSGADADD